MKKPTFEERYGPWICMGCGWPHKLGKPCPGIAVTNESSVTTVIIEGRTVTPDARPESRLTLERET